MPTYAYACTACDHRFDAQQSFTDPALTECPECAGRLRKVFGDVGVVFKGSGFYRTDSRASSNGSRGSGSKGSANGSGSTSEKSASSSGSADGGSTGSSGSDSSGSSSGSSSSSSGTAASSSSSAKAPATTG